MMKKQRVFTIIVLGLVALLLSAGPALAWGAKKIDFTATRTRNFSNSGDAEVANCWLIRSILLSYWTVTTDPGPVSHLVDGEWFNYNTKVNREVLVCDPEDPPDPSDLRNPDVGRGVIHGPFTLSPTGANGGIWEGKWKILIREDGSVAVAATAKGIGGCLDGLKLKVFSERSGLVNAPFNGYIIFPWSYRERSCDDDD
jgi:hypothetical protein